MKWCSQSESQTRIAEIQQVCWRLTNEATGEKENPSGEKVINFIESGEKVNFAGEKDHAAQVPSPFSTLYFGSCLTSSVRGGVCHNCSAQLTRWRSWPVQSAIRLLLRLEGQFLHSALCQRFPSSKNLFAYLACLSVVTQYIGGTTNPLATGLGGAHANVVLHLLKLATYSTALISSRVSLWDGIKQCRSQSCLFLARRNVVKRSMGMGLMGKGGRGVQAGV